MLSPKEYISLENACASIKGNSPALLDEVSRQISNVLNPDAQFNPETICVIENGQPKQGATITYAEIGSYLSVAMGKYIPVLLEIASGPVESNQVFVRREWLKHRLSAAKESLTLSAHLAEPAANQVLNLVQTVSSNSNAPTTWVDQPPPMSASSYKKLRQWLEHQNDQRKASQDASRLTIDLNQERAKSERLEAIAAAETAKVENLLNTIHLMTMEASNKDRAIQNLRIKIEELRDTQEAKPKETNIHRRNSRVGAAKLAAQKLATALWKTKEFADFTVGRMAFEVIGRMAIGEHADDMPETAATVTDWLNEGQTPAGARRPGRPKKRK